MFAKSLFKICVFGKLSEKNYIQMSIKKFLYTSNSSEKLLYDVNLIRKRKKTSDIFCKKNSNKKLLKISYSKMTFKKTMSSRKSF